MRSSVEGAQERSGVTYRPAVGRIGEGDCTEVIVCARVLGDPRRPAVGCRKDRSIGPNGPAMLIVWKAVRVKVLVCGRCLRLPGNPPVCSREDHTIIKVAGGAVFLLDHIESVDQVLCPCLSREPRSRRQTPEEDGIEIHPAWSASEAVEGIGFAAPPLRRQAYGDLSVRRDPRAG